MNSNEHPLNSPTARQIALSRVIAGDIFHADGSTGSTRVCLTMSVNDARILARNIPTQAIYEFDRSTGVAVRYFSSRPVYYTISSLAPLPDDIHDIFLKLDEKYRGGEYQRAENPEWEHPAAELALTDEENRAYSFIDDFYRAHPLPPP